MSRTIRGILKTKQCERFYNIEPKIYIFDLDGTIIDSSHRATHDEEGNIDLKGWKEKSTKDYIFQDSLLPLYAKLQEVYKNGDMVILCTARELGKWDYEYINMHNIYYDRIISRPKGNQTKDHILKKNQCRYLFTLPQYRDIEKWFFDDNWSNLEALADLGAVVSHAQQWNKTA
jgi:hydroxymethylpyrimidine pyrophosphatase-like HAD family hydrolase